jgi:ferric-dicitrate binding protein FerR (iron transport regulator)
MENEQDFFKKISEYYSGEEEQKVSKEDFEGSSAEKRLFDWIDRFWTLQSPKSDRTERIKRMTLMKIRPTRHPFQKFRQLAIRYAAVIILALGIGGVAYYYSRKDIQMIQAVNGIGKVKVIELPDGSKAWLNAKSSITYPEKFTGGTREVKMSGEVYLEVEHDKRHPFIVWTKDVKVQVLGTSFMVSSYNDEPEVDIYLAKGGIELEALKRNKKMKLIPGDEVTYEKSTMNFIKIHRNSFDMDSWRFGGLSFYNEPISKIARKLERRFGVSLQIANQDIGDMNFTARFENEKLEQILDFISVGSNIKYIKTATGYKITY